MTQTQTDRVRTFTWADPAINAGLLGERSGLELLQAMIAGEIPGPPVMHMLGIDSSTDMSADHGRFTVHLQPQEFHYNPLGTVHGGVLATLLDTATGCAVHFTLPRGVGYTSIDLTTRFLRQVTVDSGRLRCEGALLSAGRRTALAEARLTDGDGRLLAHATSTCLLFGTSEQGR
jgi:uncharacterized protein (TIGR00369 family)